MINITRSKQSMNRLKWGLILIGIVLLITIIYLFILYNNIERSKTADFDKGKERVLQETDLVEIDTITHFQAETAYQIVVGRTVENNQLIVFIPQENDDHDLIIINEEEITSKQRILEQWEERCKDCTFINLVPAMVNDEPLWEITYRDSVNRYIFDYVSLYDGSQYEKLQFKQIFN